MIIPAILYIAWDMYFTKIGVWSFNDEYITGIKLYNLPLEEILFFFIVPYCCVFIYACVRSYFPNLAHKKNADLALQIIAMILTIIGLIYIDRSYTSATFILTGFFIAMVYKFRKFFKSFDAVSFLVSYAICLIPFLIVNGFLTAIPVVVYNDTENLGIRIHTIPVEDIFYGMLLVMMNVVIYEKLRSPQGPAEKDKIQK